MKKPTGAVGELCSTGHKPNLPGSYSGAQPPGTWADSPPQPWAHCFAIAHVQSFAHVFASSCNGISASPSFKKTSWPTAVHLSRSFLCHHLQEALLHLRAEIGHPPLGLYYIYICSSNRLVRDLSPMGLQSPWRQGLTHLVKLNKVFWLQILCPFYIFSLSVTSDYSLFPEHLSAVYFLN